MPRLSGAVSGLVNSIGAVANPVSQAGTVDGFFDEVFGLFSPESYAYALSLSAKEFELFIKLHLDEAIEVLDLHLADRDGQTVCRISRMGHTDLTLPYTYRTNKRIILSRCGSL